MVKEDNKNAFESEGWRSPQTSGSLRESFQSIPVPRHWPWWRKILAFSGPGYLVAVGYMDPGNWATDLAGGSRFGYALLSVVLLSCLMGIFLQFLSAKLGIVTGRDLAQACKDHYSKPTVYLLWILCEIAICACDLAEVIGSAIALNLLFNLPLLWGVLITATDVFLIIYLQKLNFRYIEAVVITLILVIAVSLGIEIFLSRPAFTTILHGFIPHQEIVTNPEMLYLAIGILGATVMPHNLYLHSSVVQTRKYRNTVTGKREAIKFVSLDSTIALFLAFSINAALLIMAASIFHSTGHLHVADITEAYKLLTPLLNAPLASTLFALALLASGQNSTLTGTLAGQIVMEGFLDIRMRPWLRRLLTRSVAIIPAILCILLYGEQDIGKLLIFSQVILSFQLAFAVIPLIIFTSDKRKMKEFVNTLGLKIVAWMIATLIISLNIKYLIDFFGVN